MLKLTIIAGARPNFMKIAPLIRAIESIGVDDNKISYRLVHTGQHYDKAMSGSFFDQLGIPEPHINLECGGGTQAEQTAAIMVAIERELLVNIPDWLIVVGDVTSTMACSIVAKKLGIKVAHIEGGIRSGDMEMPEEINRLVTDSISDLFFTTSETANQNLLHSGIKPSQISFVGNTMIDTLYHHISDFSAPEFWKQENLVNRNYIVVTLHRPSNVDQSERLRDIIQTLENSLGDCKVVFPVHPRTRGNMEKYGIQPNRITMVEPLSYFEFMYLVKNAKGVITDSGGITEETTVLGIPCITMRNSTERPETCDIGTNELVGTDLNDLKRAIEKLLNGNWKKGSIPELWDGKTAQRIVERFLELSIEYRVNFKN